MTFALDATYSVGRDLSGVGVYSRELPRALAAAHPEARFRWHYRAHRFWRGLRDPKPGNCAAWLLQEPLPVRGRLFHGLNQRLPEMSLPAAVTTFHDLFVLTGDYSTAEFRARFAQQARDAARRSDAIIAVSQFTADQVRDCLGVEERRLHVVPHGVRPLALPNVPRERVVLHVGAIQKRKNVARLVEAFERLPEDWRLVLAGSAGYGAAEIEERIARSPARARVLVTGYVSDADLAAWFARASIFAFPSLDEGFGIPVVEAMAAGVPVLTSRGSATGEVAGDAALLIDPQETESVAGALLQLASDETLRAELAARGRRRAARYTWERAAELTWAVYRKLLL